MINLTFNLIKNNQRFPQISNQDLNELTVHEMVPKNFHSRKAYKFNMYMVKFVF